MIKPNVEHLICEALIRLGYDDSLPNRYIDALTELRLIRKDEISKEHYDALRRLPYGGTVIGIEDISNLVYLCADILKSR